ncbi:subtilisin-like protease-like, partial [Trifolium medium]|nr:subtilisin-like protease-like [Trifolium medium]
GPLAVGSFAAMEHGILVSCAEGNLDPKSPRIINIAPWISTMGVGTLFRNFLAWSARINGEEENVRVCVGKLGHRKNHMKDYGEAIKKYLFSQNPNKLMAMDVFERTKLGIESSYVVAMFSSRGPNSITSQILKLDFIALGVNILAASSGIVSPTNEDWDPRCVDFNIYFGMPRVSWIATLIKSIHPYWSSAAIQFALITKTYMTYKNRKTLLVGGNKKVATSFDFEARHVNPILALIAELVYDLMDGYLSFLYALNYSAAYI